MTWLLLIVFVGVLLAILVPVIRLGIAALGTPADRAAANGTLRLAAVLLGGRYLDRREYPWYRRPAQYGAVEGDLGNVGYQVTIMPWNTEDAGGSAMVRIRSRAGSGLAGGRAQVVVFSPEHVWHWPDLADPAALADYARQAISAADSAGVPPDAP